MADTQRKKNDTKNGNGKIHNEMRNKSNTNRMNERIRSNNTHIWWYGVSRRQNTRQHKRRHSNRFDGMQYSIRLQVCFGVYFWAFFHRFLFVSDYHNIIELKFLWDWCVIYFFVSNVQNEKCTPHKCSSTVLMVVPRFVLRDTRCAKHISSDQQNGWMKNIWTH